MSCVADGNLLFLYKEGLLVSCPQHGHQGHQSSFLRHCYIRGLLSISGDRPYIRKLWKLQKELLRASMCYDYISLGTMEPIFYEKFTEN
jgi:hypothetical protein